MGMIARTVRRALPLGLQPTVRYYYERARGLLERELPFAVAALEPGDRAIDVGANVGIYTYAFARAGARVEAFEPQPQCVRVLAAFAARHADVHVHPVALGRAAGESTLHVPVVGDLTRTGEASLRSVGGTKLKVAVRTLDSFQFEDVALIKIDVEGLESEVLAGGAETLRRLRPLLLVEIEQRHRQEPIGGVFDALGDLGYEGFFLDGAMSLRPIEEFDVGRHQANGLSGFGLYINNFLFQAAAGPPARQWDRGGARR